MRPPKTLDIAHSEAFDVVLIDDSIDNGSSLEMRPSGRNEGYHGGWHGRIFDITFI